MFSPNKLNISSLTFEVLFKLYDIKNLSKHHLIAIGSHAHTHCSLKHLKDEQVTWELEYSKKLIEKKINKVVNHLAFPFGTKNHVSKRDHIIARKCGYKTAVQTTVKVLNKAEELYSLPRLSVRNTNSSVIDAKLNGVDNFVYSLTQNNDI